MKKLCVITLWAALSCAGLAGAQETAIKAGKLIDKDAGKVLAEQIILIRGGRVMAVGKGLEIPAGAQLIDLSAMTVLRGLIDCHTHLTDSDTEVDPLDEPKTTAAQKAFGSIPNARKTLEAGFTTVRLGCI